MNIPGVGGLERDRSTSLLYSLYEALRLSMTGANLVAVIGAICALFLFLTAPEPWNIRLPLYLTVLVWTILRPRIALYLLPFAVPWGSMDTLSVGGLHLNSADILVVFLATGWLMSFALRPLARHMATGAPGSAHYPYIGPLDREPLNTPRYLAFAMLALLVSILLSMATAITISSSLKEFAKWLEFLVIVLLGTQYLRTRRQVWTLIVLVILAGVSQAVYGYIQYFYNLGPTAFVRDTSLRVYGTFDQPNPFAGYINLSLSIALALLLLGRGRGIRILAGLATLTLGGAEYLTQSRGGEIALAVVVAFLVLVGMPRIRPLLGLLGIGGLGLIELYLVELLPASIFTPVLRILGLVSFSFVSPSSQDYSTAERLAHWIAGIRMFLDHPFLGVGAGNYPDAYPRYYITIFVNPLGHAHNYYINVAAETGVVGLTAYLLFLFAIFVAGGTSYLCISKQWKQIQARIGVSQTRLQLSRQAETLRAWLKRPAYLIRYYQQQDNAALLCKLTADRALAVGLLAALLSVAVHNMVDDLYVHSVPNLIALLVVALIRLEGVTPKSGDNGG